MFRLSGLYFAFLPRSAAFVESFPPLFRGGRRGPEICRGRNPQRPGICRGSSGRRLRGKARSSPGRRGESSFSLSGMERIGDGQRESGGERREREGGDIGGRKRRVGGRKAGDWPVRREAAGGCGPGLGRGRNGRVSGRIRLLFYRRVRCVSGGGRLQSPYSGRYRPDLPQGRGP